MEGQQGSSIPVANPQSMTLKERRKSGIGAWMGMGGYFWFAEDYLKFRQLEDSRWGWDVENASVDCSVAWEHLSQLERRAYHIRGTPGYLPPTPAQMEAEPLLWRTVEAISKDRGLYNAKTCLFELEEPSNFAYVFTSNGFVVKEEMIVEDLTQDEYGDGWEDLVTPSDDDDNDINIITANEERGSEGAASSKAVTGPSNQVDDDIAARGMIKSIVETEDQCPVQVQVNLTGSELLRQRKEWNEQTLNKNRAFALFSNDFEKMGKRFTQRWNCKYSPAASWECTKAWRNMSKLDQEAYQTRANVNYQEPTSEQKRGNPELWKRIAAIGGVGLRVTLRLDGESEPKAETFPGPVLTEITAGPLVGVALLPLIIDHDVEETAKVVINQINSTRMVEGGAADVLQHIGIGTDGLRGNVVGIGKTCEGGANVALIMEKDEEIADLAVVHLDIPYVALGGSSISTASVAPVNRDANEKRMSKRSECGNDN